MKRIYFVKFEVGGDRFYYLYELGFFESIMKRVIRTKEELMRKNGNPILVSISRV